MTLSTWELAKAENVNQFTQLARTVTLICFT